ncbi:fibronectin type III domain-containing protein [Nocardioides panacis]|uniref:Fibronectin type III domain-containing protein n=1 Tax=Nocardioides panacis TaxID=2849501 RepID=A0A975SWM7_9ACTN|nr:Ig-like domain-containing protein [Nocardioides panacis]QWZ06693.1 fibronectin type III domain-containing protein [Nocardioides panacis]
MHLSRLVSGTSALAVAVAGATFVITSPAAQALQSAVPSNTAPAYQTNGNVSTIAYSKASDIVYIGGDFTSVRPPGAAPGTGEVARTRLAAFNASTGALITSFNHNVPASVKSLATNPDGSVLYVGGDFTTIDGTTRNRVAAFNTGTGALTSWNPSASNRVSAIAATASTVYLGGTFARVGGAAEQRVAAVTATTGAARTDFNVSADNLPYQMAVSPDGSRLYLAGSFLSLNGNTDYHAVGAVNATTGALLPFSAGSIIPPKSPACIVEARSVKTDADGTYFGVEGTGGGCFDGTFAVNDDGSLKWQSQCLGATQAVQPVKGDLYTGSHSHDCVQDQPGGASGLNDPDAFPEVGWSRGISRHLLSRSTTTGKLGNWYPNTNGGPNGQGLGPRSMASDGTQLFVGGEFTTVNGQAQQGFARFSPSTGDTAAPAAPTAPTAVARGGGRVSVFVQAPLDTDDTDLTISLYRDGGTTPIATKNVHALFWRDPVVGFTDNDLAVGSRHTYRVDAREVNGPNVGPKSAASNTVTVVSSAPSYAASVAASNPTSYWRLGDTHAPATADFSDQLEGGVTFGGVTFNQPGVTTDGDNAIVTDGSSGIVSSTDAMPSPSTFSVEAWFKTTSTSGGKIIGFGDRQQGYDFGGNPALSGSYDKQVYMTNDGRLVFGVYNGGADTLTTGGTKAYNDGAWHHVVGTQGPGGMALYVDGARSGRNGVTTNQSYPGYWRVGGDNLNGWPNQPSSNYFAGSIDEVATYDHAIPLTDVQAHYSASGRTLPPSNLPTDTYGRTVAGDSPSAYWRLDETSGTTAADSSDNGDTGTYVGGVTQGRPGALGGQGTAATFDGSTGNVTETSSRSGPSAFTAELWFNTDTQSGGKLIGFGDASTGLSGSYDKQVYMLNDGRLVFGNYNNGFDTIYSSRSYNDAAWHYLVVTQGPNGMTMYVDNAAIGTHPATTNQRYTGYWRAGGDNLAFWPDQPSSAYLAGTMDEVALYDAPLSADQINAHYIAAGRNGRDVTNPETAITSPHQGDVVTTGQVTVSATATDNVGVSQVDLQVDGTTVGTDTTAPYTFDWTATDGEHTLQTVAHDAAGNTGTSSVVQVTGTTPDTTDPTTSITSPADGATVSGPTTVTADAADNRGVTTVRLQVDGTTVDTSTTAPYTFTWNANDPGAHTLRTVASDAAGNTGTSAPVNVTVPVPADTTPPTAPTGLTATATSPTTVDLSWGASTDNRGVTGYQVVRGSTVVDTVTGRTYTDTGLTAGTSYSYVVRAVDAAGNVSGDSNTATVTTPDPNAALFSDTWSAADGSPWKAGWTTGQASGTVDTQAGQGRLAFTDVANAYARAQITGAPAQADTELLTSYQWSATTPGSYLNVYLRGSGGWQNAYRPRSGYGLELTSNSGTVVVRKNVASTTTNLASVPGGQAVTTAKQWLRIRVSGSTVQFRIWRDGTTEPTAWTGTYTDTSVTAPGQVFVSLVRGGTNSGVKSVSLDDLRLTQQ